MMKRLVSSALLVATLALPAAASADTPSYRTPSGEETIDGVISTINGKYGLTVRDDHGGFDNVTMHRGTIINPIGSQLKPGMQVTIVGHEDGRTFDANKIDAPFEASNRSIRSADGSTATAAPVSVPSGTFQTNGPSAEGGG